MRLEELDLDAWGSALPDTGFEVFHLPEALRVLDDHVTADLRLYGGFKGEHPVALAPVFVRENALGRVATSPPPGWSVPRLGPLVMPASPKQRKRESVNRAFVEALMDELDVDDRRTLLRMECPTDYDDPRPFRWAGLQVDQEFTYILRVDSPEAVLEGFSRDLRKEVRDAEALPVTVEREGLPGARRVFEDVVERFDEQDEPFPVSWSFLRDLVAALEDRCRVYVARAPDGSYQGGVVVLYSNDVASFWQGGVRTEYDGVSVNSLVHWRIIQDVTDDPPVDSVWGYDLVGANTPRLCQYKAKFGADLVPYYAVESDGVPMAVAKRAYSLVAR